MAMRVSDFARLGTDGGFFKKDMGTGELKVGGQGFFGRVAGWFRSTSKPGTVAENLGALNAFIRTIGTDPKYGPKFADMASRELSHLAETGKPLTARMVRDLTGKMDREMDQVKGLNKMLGERFAEYDIHGDPHCFGSLFANVSHEKGFNIGLDNLDTTGLKDAIREGIREAGQNGRHAVSLKEAGEIAKREIGKFITDKQTLFNAIDGMHAEPSDKTALKEMVCRNGGIRRPEYLEQVLSMKTAGHDLLTALSQPNLSREDVMRALTQYSGEYSKAFGKIRKEGDGADDVVRLAGDSLQFGLMTAGLDTNARQAIYSLLTSPDCRELRQAFSFIGMKQGEVEGVDEQTALLVANNMARPQEFISELTTTIGMSLGFSREQTFKALDEPALVYDDFAQIPQDIVAFARELGAQIPDNLTETRTVMSEEFTHDPTTVLRGNDQAWRTIKGFMTQHAQSYSDTAMNSLEQAKETVKGTPQEVYNQFLQNFLGGSTPEEVRANVRNHPERFGAVRNIARMVYGQGCEIGSPKMARDAINSILFLRTVGPELAQHNFDPDNREANVVDREVAHMLQSDLNQLGTHDWMVDVPLNGPPPQSVKNQELLLAFLQEVTGQ